MEKSKKYIIRIIVILSAGILIAAAPKAYLNLENQPISASVRIKKMFLKEGAFLVIYNDKDGLKEDNLIGNSDYFPPGIYSDFYVELYLLYLKDHKPTDGIFVVLYKDNGDKHFDLKLDSPFRDFLGRIVGKYAFYK